MMGTDAPNQPKHYPSTNHDSNVLMLWSNHAQTELMDSGNQIQWNRQSYCLVYAFCYETFMIALFKS